MINGHEYAWEDMEIVIEGKNKPLEGVVELNYSKKKEQTNIYGRGADPVAAGRGKNEYSGNLVLLQSEFDAWNESLGAGKDITDLKGFSIAAAYAPEGGKESTDILTYCRAGEWKKGMKTGDGNMTIDIPLVIGKVKLNQ